MYFANIASVAIDVDGSGNSDAIKKFNCTS